MSKDRAPDSRRAGSPSPRYYQIHVALFFALVLMVAIPPIYMAFSGSSPWWVLPKSVNFLLIHGFLCVLLAVSLYVTEMRKGDLESFIDQDGQGDVSEQASNGVR